MINNKEVYSLTFLGVEGTSEDVSAILTTVSEVEQTLEVDGGPGARPYYIIGRRTSDDSVFVGKHHGMKDDPRVFARWVVDEGTVMGIWVEDDVPYSFSGFKDSSLVGFNLEVNG